MNKKHTAKIVAFSALFILIAIGVISLTLKLKANSATQYVDISIVAPASFQITGMKIVYDGGIGISKTTQTVQLQEPYTNTAVIPARKNAYGMLAITYKSTTSNVQVFERRMWDQLQFQADTTLPWSSYTRIDPPPTSLDKIPFLMSADEHVHILAPIKSTAVQLVLNLKNGGQKVIKTAKIENYPPFYLADFDGYLGYYFDGDDISPDMVKNYVFYMKNSKGELKSYYYANVDDMFIVQPAGDLVLSYIFKFNPAELTGIKRSGNMVWFRVQNYNYKKNIPRNYKYLGTGYKVASLGNHAYSQNLYDFNLIDRAKGYTWGNDMEGLSFIWQPAQ